MVTVGGDSCGGNGGGAMVGAGELNIVEVVDDGEDNVIGVVGVAGIEGISDSFNTVTKRMRNVPVYFCFFLQRCLALTCLAISFPERVKFSFENVIFRHLIEWRRIFEWIPL